MFKGRKKEIDLLRSENWRDRAQLIVVYGRRRVGKTALIEKAYENKIIWKFEGIENGSTKKQIKHFLYLLSGYCNNASIKNNINKITSWEEALTLLNKNIGDKKLVIFFDEFQWLSSMRKSLVSAFKWAWDNLLSGHKNCRFVLCGSVSSFIVRKVIKSSALYGRIDLELNLKPFTVSETYDFFDNKRSKQEVLEIYFTIGGIPQYILELDPKKSLTQNLNTLAFSGNGYFFNEYQRLFISHFSKNKNYEKILRYLAKKNNQTIQELASSLKIKTGGTLTQLIEDMVLAGFIEKFSPLDKADNSKILKIRIEDEFLGFYYNFIEKNRKSIEENTIKGFELLTGACFEQWRGYAFEKLCRKHAFLISRALGFSGIRYDSGAWFRTKEDFNAQIDLMFDRADRVLSVCEIKYVNRLNTTLIINSFEKKLKVLRKYYSYPFQKVLILGFKNTIPPKINNYFDSILFAEDVFFMK